VITSVELVNFRCFREAKIDLAPLTVFVGGNGAGKSTMLRALLREPELTSLDAWQHVANVDVEVGIRFEDRSEWRRWRRLSSGSGKGGTAYSAQMLHLDLRRMRSPAPTQHEVRLETDGHNLVSVFASLGREAQVEISDELCRMIPLFHAVEHAPSKHAVGHHELRFRDRWNTSIVYSVDEVSDGTLLAMAFTLLPCQEPAPDLLLIEEPERGLHPYLLGELVAQLRALATRERRAVQIVMATHSAALVDHLHPNEVRFLRRDPQDGSVRVQAAPVDDPQWKTALAEYETLGSMWLSGGLGGVPGT